MATLLWSCVSGNMENARPEIDTTFRPNHLINDISVQPKADVSLLSCISSSKDARDQAGARVLSHGWTGHSGQYINVPIFSFQLAEPNGIKLTQRAEVIRL